MHFRLSQFEKLFEWFHGSPINSVASEDDVFKYVNGICMSLTQEGAERSSLFCKISKTFFNNSGLPLDDFLTAEKFLADKGLALSLYISSICEDSSNTHHIDKLIDVLHLYSEKTTLISFKFLKAWAQFQAGHYQDCIEECEKEDGVLSSFQTLLGQAQLKLGLASEAIESLQISLKLSPEDSFTLFQLSKAYFVIGDLDKAWEMANKSLIHAENKIEIIYLMAAIALADQEHSDKLHSAWRLIMPYLESLAGQETIIALLFDLSTKMQDQHKCLEVIENADWKKLVAEEVLPQFVSKNLRRFHTLNWNRCTVSLLDKVIESQRKGCATSPSPSPPPA